MKTEYCEVSLVAVCVQNLNTRLEHDMSMLKHKKTYEEKVKYLIGRQEYYLGYVRALADCNIISNKHYHLITLDINKKILNEMEVL